MVESLARVWRFAFGGAILLGPLFVATPALGFVGAAWDYVKQYQLGVDYTNSYDQVSASYETGLDGVPGYNCKVVKDKTSRQRCDVPMRGGSSSGFGLVLQQAFRRQGTFYFTADVGFGARYLEGRMQDDTAEDVAATDLPLESLRFSLAALLVKPYLQVGITPADTWPDVLLSLGPALQLAAGRVSVNEEPENVAMGTASGTGLGGLLGGFYELEIVFWRFGDGAVSVFTSNDFTGGEGTKFYPESVDGMTDFEADFSRNVNGKVFGFGGKLVLDWP